MTNATVTLVLIFLGGLTLTAVGFAAAAGGRRRRAWPLAKGTVVRGEVLRLDEQNLATHYVGVVRYVYALQAVSAYRGTDHQMEGRLESPPYPDREAAEAHLSAYPVGDRIDVRYDPARPTRSLLGPTPEAPPFAKALAFVGLAVSFVSAALALGH
jgi:Protein of unknown function (DUF3592)